MGKFALNVKGVRGRLVLNWRCSLLACYCEDENLNEGSP